MVTAKQPVLLNRRKYIRSGIMLLLFSIGLFFIVPQVADLSDARDALWKSRPVWLVLALGCLLLTFPVAGLIYRLLGYTRLPYARTVLIQMASMFASRVLPAGVGALGVNYQYLRQHKHTRIQAGAVVALNNGLGFVGNALLILSMLLTGAALPAWQLPGLHLWLLLGLLVAVLVGFSARHTRFGRRLLVPSRSLITSIAAYRRKPAKLVLALVVSMLLTALYGLLLYACARAIGPQISFATAVIITTVGVVGATATPTPGGIGGAEAALAASLALYHIDTSTAVAIALLYRWFTYFIGLVLGVLALAIARRCHYL